MQPHIKRELENCNFDLFQLQALLNQGEDALARKRRIWNAIFAHPDMQKLPSYYSLTRQQKMKHNLKMMNVFIFEVAPRLGFKLNLKDIFMASRCLSGQFPFGVHYFMFYITVSALASKEQFQYWIPKIKNIDIIGCYAQTQLGHGSNVRGLETTATYDTKTHEFVINSPKTSSAKFWPGELGKFATHAILVARLIIKGKDFGPQTFIIQIRSTQTHDLISGVEAGDIGTKHGYQTKDNGYAVFTNYRVPRSSLLDKFFTIDDQTGEFKVIGNPKAAYFTMMMNRVGIVNEARLYLSQALTIALRYSAYRQQFQTLDNSKDERPVIDYQMQQYRLTPVLAEAFTYHFVGEKVSKMYSQVRDELVNLGTTNKLGELHRIISGLKSFVTWKTFESLDELRAACGGHGYLEISGISQRVLDYSARTVYQGQNAVMTQQTAMALFKVFEKIVSGAKRASIDENMRYLHDLHAAEDKGKMKAVTKEQIMKALRRRAYHSISETATKMMKFVQEGKSMNIVFNEYVQKDALKMTKHHCQVFIYETFYNFIVDQEKSIDQKLEPSLMIHLNRLLLVFGIKTLLNDISPLYRCHHIQGDNEVDMEKRLMDEIRQLRPMLLPLVEGFAWPDEILNSAIGSKTKDPYEEIMRSVREDNSLNKKDKVDGFEQYVRPILRAKL